MDESCGRVGSMHFSNFCFLSDLIEKKKRLAFLYKITLTPSQKYEKVLNIS